MEGATFFHDMKKACGFGRCLPERKDLENNSEICLILQCAVIVGQVRGDISKNKALDFVYKKGWLHAEVERDSESSFYIVPTYIHHRYVSTHVVEVTAFSNCLRQVLH